MCTAVHFLTGVFFSLYFTSGVWAQCTAGEMLTLKVDSIQRSFESPNYPDPYPSKTTCQWLLDATSKKYRVKLQTAFALNLEASAGCRYDHISIFDGKKDALLPTLDEDRRCVGNMSMVSKGRYLTVVFQSDNMTETSAFKFLYVAVAAPGYEVTPSGEGVNNGVHKGGSSVKTEILIGGIIGGVVLIVIIGVVCGRCMGSGRPRQPPEHRPAAFYHSHAPYPGDTSAISTALMVQNSNSVFMVSQAMGRNLNPPRYASQINAGMTNMGFDEGGEDGARLAAAGFLGPPSSGEPPPSYCASMLVTNPPSIPTTPRRTTSEGSAEGSGVNPLPSPARSESAENPEQQQDSSASPKHSDSSAGPAEAAAAGPSTSDEECTLEKTVCTGTSAPVPHNSRTSASNTAAVTSPSLTVSDKGSTNPEESDQDGVTESAEVLEPQTAHGESQAAAMSSECPGYSSITSGDCSASVSEPGTAGRKDVDANVKCLEQTKQAAAETQAEDSQKPNQEPVSGSESNSPNAEIQALCTSVPTTNTETSNLNPESPLSNSETPDANAESRITSSESSALNTNGSNTSATTNNENPTPNTKNSTCGTENQSSDTESPYSNTEHPPTRTETPSNNTESPDHDDGNKCPHTENLAITIESTSPTSDKETIDTDDTTANTTNSINSTENVAYNTESPNAAASDSFIHDIRGSVSSNNSSDPTTDNALSDFENTATDAETRDPGTNKADADTKSPIPSTDTPDSATADNTEHAPTESENTATKPDSPVTNTETLDPNEDDATTPMPSCDYDTDDVFEATAATPTPSGDNVADDVFEPTVATPTPSSDNVADDVFDPSSPPTPDPPAGRLMPKPGCGSLSDVSISSEMSVGSEQQHLRPCAERMDSTSSLPPPPSPHPSAGGDLDYDTGCFPSPPPLDSDGDCPTPRRVDSPVGALPPDCQ